jgi:anionic cell wall polymer biosynthesis LytR-Cps2A-Psr (LCP) family protein
MRHRYGSSDYKRTERQRNVITALFRQVVSSRDLSDIYALVRQGFGMIKTNIPLDEMIDLAASVVGNGANMSIGSQRMPFKATSVYFNIGKQEWVSSSGTGAAQVLKIDFEYEAQKVNEYIYGK